MQQAATQMQLLHTSPHTRISKQKKENKQKNAIYACVCHACTPTGTQTHLGGRIAIMVKWLGLMTNEGLKVNYNKRCASEESVHILDELSEKAKGRRRRSSRQRVGWVRAGATIM